MNMQCIFLVGGKGTRLGDYTKNTPKPLLPIGDKPFIDLAINHAIKCGFTKILLMAGYLGEQFYPYHLLNRQNAHIQIFIEPSPMGTAGALAMVANRLEPEFLVVNGDSFIDCDWHDAMINLQNTPKAELVMALSHQASTARYGKVQTKIIKGKKWVSEFCEKNGIHESGDINAGVYAVRKQAVLNLIKRQPCGFETDILPQLCQKNQILAMPCDGYFIDMGIPESYQEAIKKFG